MGRFIATVLFAMGVSSTAVCAPSEKDAALQKLLEQSYSDFQNLSLDLPFVKVKPKREHAVRERFKDATRTLFEATREIGWDNGKSRELTRGALNELRRVGLLLPFVEMDLPDDVMDRYIAAEDRLFFSLRVFDGTAVAPVAEDVWRNNGLAWKPLKGQVNLREAQENCAAMMATKSTGWRVPSLDELLGAFVAMKTPASNRIFGTEAGSFRQVWTSTQNVEDPASYELVDFESGKSVLSGPLTSFHAVCVGKDTSSSGG